VQSAGAGGTGRAVGPLSPDQQPATKADLYAAVDALRADMHELMDQVRILIADADRRVSEAERASGQRGPTPQGGPAGRDDNAEW